ncbi:MAG: hypothetical protein R2709_04005 [Marmoricola sp.]
MPQQYGFHDVEARWAQIDESAHISPMSVIGAPGEWLGKPSSHPVIVRAGAVVREFASIHAGCVRQTIVGEEALVMTGSYVAHDVILGRNVHVAPNATIGGLAEIGDYSRIGLNATVLPTARWAAIASSGQGLWSPTTSPTDRSGPAIRPPTARMLTDRSLRTDLSVAMRQ